MAGHSAEMVAKLWSLCNTLRDDGISYQDYVGELTSLLFLKMLQETGQEHRVPVDCTWHSLSELSGRSQLDQYRHILMTLSSAEDETVNAVYNVAQTKIRKSENLETIVSALDELTWFAGERELLGDVYEGILERNASDRKSGAGQYFTPRPLIDCMVRLLKPRFGEVVQDPAAGTGGFIVSAFQFAAATSNGEGSTPEKARLFGGMELVPETYRLALMNLALHGIEGSLLIGDTLTEDGDLLPDADVILTNPPFGTKRGGTRPDRIGFEITKDSSNKQLGFIEHVVRSLKPGGRSALVLPDNVLFEAGVGKRLRTWMMDCCNVHTILRLPTGIFYAHGVMTNVVFLTRSASGAATNETWIYDMRANALAYGKSRTLSEADFSDFEAAFGSDPTGQSLRVDQGTSGKFRRFSRSEIAARGDNLDISWLGEVHANPEDLLSEPDDLAAAALEHLRSAISQLEAVLEEPGLGLAI